MKTRLFENGASEKEKSSCKPMKRSDLTMELFKGIRQKESVYLLIHFQEPLSYVNRDTSLYFWCKKTQWAHKFFEKKKLFYNKPSLGNPNKDRQRFFEAIV